jgi:hypothetical protein
MVGDPMGTERSFAGILITINENMGCFTAGTLQRVNMEE